jgi:hypothetical protein
MAMDEILATVDAKLQDPTTGLAAKTAARAAALGMTSGPKGRIRTDFFFESWLTSGKVRPATVPQIGVRPRSWRPREKLFVNSPRLADAQLEVVLEVVAADQAVIEDNAAVIAAALMQCLDELELWSRAHAGTIKDYRDPTDFTFGTFDGTPTSGGFRAVFNLLEESLT